MATDSVKGSHTSAAALSRNTVPQPGSAWNRVHPVTQDAPGFTKHWFCHPTSDLFVWLDAHEQVASFQFCFAKGGDEKMVVWDQGKTAQMGRLDTGDQDPKANRSPIMVGAGGSLKAQALDAWLQVREGLPPFIQAAVELALSGNSVQPL